MSIGKAQAQTQEETITWLTEKLKLALHADSRAYCNLTLEGLTACEMTVSLTDCYRGSSSYGRKTTYTLPIHGIRIGITRAKFSSGVVERTVFRYSFDAIKNSNGGQEEWSVFEIDTEKEEDLKERMHKAFTHLATFCPKKEETF
jgi:hypothetical protein